MAAAHCSRGCAFGDFDNDGDVDILIVNLNEPPSLLRNDVTGGNHWIEIKLTGVESNRSAIGARATVRYGGKVQTQEVLSQSSYLSVNDRRLHFRTRNGNRCGYRDSVAIGRVERLSQVAADQLVWVTEGSGVTRVRKAFPMSTQLLVGLSWAGLLLAQQIALDEAWELVAVGKRPEAIHVLEQIIKADPRHGEARLFLGSILADDGRTAEAVDHLTEAVRLLPRSPMACNALGEALISSGDLAAARNALEQALATDPEFAQAHVNLGHVLISDGRLSCRGTTPRPRDRIPQASAGCGTSALFARQDLHGAE